MARFFLHEPFKIRYAVLHSQCKSSKIHIDFFFLQGIKLVLTVPEHCWVMWHDVGHSLCGYGWVPVRGFLRLFWNETHTKGLPVRSPTRSEEEEGRQGPKTEENRRKHRRGQSREESSQEKRAGARPCRLRGRVGQREMMS